MIKRFGVVHKKQLSLVRGAVFVLLGLMIFTFGIEIYAADPEADIRLLVEGQMLKYKNMGDRATLVDQVVEGKDLFEAGYAHEMMKVYQKDYRVLEAIHQHLTEFEPFCEGGGLMSWDKDQEKLVRYTTPNQQAGTRDPVDVALKDVVNVFSETRQGRDVLALLESRRVRDRSVSKTSDDTFQRSCKRVYGCQYRLVKQLEIQDVAAANESLTAEQIDGCIAIVQDLYDWYSPQTSTHLSYDENRDWEVYWNGVMESDRGQFCDVNALIGDINKTLSCGSNDVPRYSAYDPQDIAKTVGEDVRLPDTYSGVDENLPDNSMFDNINEYIPTIGVPQNDREREETADYMQSRNNGKQVVGPEYTQGGGVSRLIPKPKEAGLDALSEQGNKNDRVGSHTSCTNVQCDQTDLGEEDAPVDLYDESIQLDETLHRYDVGLDVSQRLALDLGASGVLNEREQEEYLVSDPRIPEGELFALVDEFNALNKIDNPDVEAVVEQTKGLFAQCIEKHTDEDPESIWEQISKHTQGTAEVMACVQKAMCTEISDPTGLRIYAVRMCSRPSRQRTASTVQPVMCMSDTMDAQLTTLDNMNTSGRMVRHIKSKEFLEFQAFDIDYSARFVFSLNTNLKKPKKTQEEKTEKLMTEQELDQVQQVFLNERQDPNVIYPNIAKNTFNNVAAEEALEQDQQFGVDYQGASTTNRRVQGDVDTSQFAQRYSEQIRRDTHLTQGVHGTEFVQQQMSMRESVADNIDTLRRSVELP